MKIQRAICGLAVVAVLLAALPGRTQNAPDGAGNSGKAGPTADEMKALLKRAHDEVSTAKKPADLDDLLAALQKYQNRPDYEPETATLQGQLRAALEFTTSWQDYLVHKDRPNLAANDLQRLASSCLASGLMPRSKILALLNAAQAPVAPGDMGAPWSAEELDAVGKGVKTLDDLAPALEKLLLMGQTNLLARSYADEVRPMMEAYVNIKAGLPAQVDMQFMAGKQGMGVSPEVNAMLLDFILQHYFDTYPGPPPGANELPAAYDTRVRNDALKRQDWPLLKKALNAHAYLYKNIPSALGDGPVDNEIAGFDRMFEGLNQEEAQQYALAVVSFQTALKAASLDIPAKFIGGKLDAIKREHPAEYQAGMEQFLAPKQVAFPGRPYFPGYPYPGGMMQPGMPGFPGTMPSQPNPVLSIPGKTPAPAGK